MAAPISENKFVAPITSFSTEVNGSAQSLMSFCVSARLASSGWTRAEWAAKLVIKPSYLSAMASLPTDAFIANFDRMAPPQSGGQRLTPLLSGPYAEVSSDNGRSDAEGWLSIYFDLLGRQNYPIVAPLLRSEVVIARCRHPREGDALRFDPRSSSALEALMTIASGPYGGSLLAMQRCAELGQLIPEPFFDCIESHLNNSPVGFRLLRTLDRFVRSSLDGKSHIDSEHGQIVEMGLRRLLMSLIMRKDHSSFLDPYPGGEWGISLAHERLKIRNRDRYALSWSKQTAADRSRSPRERLYASWVYFNFSRRYQSMRGVLDSPDSRVVQHWQSILDSLVNKGQSICESFPDVAVRERAFSNAVRGDAYFEAIRSTIIKSVTSSDVHKSLHDAFSSIIHSILITPNGRLRRSLIESIPAASLVLEAIPIFMDVYNEFDDPFVRETILFCMGRFREPSPQVVETLLAAASSHQSDLARTGLWAIGDVLPNDVRFVHLLTTFAESLRAGALGELVGGRENARLRIAAAHSLAISASYFDSPLPGELLESIGIELTESSSTIDQNILGLTNWGLSLVKCRALHEIVNPKTSRVIT